MVYNFTMNRLTNEQRKSFNFIIKMRALLPFYDQFNRSLLFGLLWLNFAPNLHCWTLNHQHAYVECELKKISQLYRPVLMMTINYRFVAAIGPLLLNNMENFAEGFSCEAIQNTASARIEAAEQNFWWMGFWKVGRRSTFLSKNCV